MHVGQTAEPVTGKARAGDFAGFLARNLTDSYRLATMALGNPVAAQGVVHDAALEAWRAGSDWPAGALDAAFAGRFEAGCVAALRVRDDEPAATGVDPIEAALPDLPAADRLRLARAFGLAAEGGSVDRRAARILGALSTDTGPPLEPRLRAIYRARDPGREIPLALRLRLQRSLFEAEAAVAEKEERARASGWGFVFNLALVVAVLTLVVSLASVLDLRGSPAAGADPMGDPASPLTVAGVSVVQAGIVGPEVKVAATQTSFVVAFAASAVWHVSPQQCLADVVGVLDPGGQAQWLGERAGHVDAIAGDPSSAGVYATGPGQYCQLGRYSSSDGGRTWSPGSAPTGAATSPSWMAFDPAHAGTLFAFDSGVLYASPNSGATWTSTPTQVTPIGFDADGRLVGWSPGGLFESLDDGSSWRRTGAGPADRPVAAAATPNGVLLGSVTGLWWYPLSATPSLVRSGSVYSISGLAQGALVLGADAAGRPWLGTVSDSQPGMSLATLPPELASVTVTGGQIAANDSGAVVALSGKTSAIGFVTFER